MSDKNILSIEDRIEAIERELTMNRRLGPSPWYPYRSQEEADRAHEEFVDSLVRKFKEATKMVRGKFQLVSITSHQWSKDSKTLKFLTVYDPSIPEDVKFARATPSGSIEMQVDNPSALDKLELGKYYYVDFSPVE